MSEIEKCCRYSYGQILMARLLCLCVLTLTTFLIAMLPGVVSRQELGFLLPLVLPAACGALLALIWANYVSRSDIAQMTVYLVGALAVSMMQETIQEMGTHTVCAALLLIAAALLLTVYNIRESDRAGAESEEMVVRMKSLTADLPERLETEKKELARA